MNVTFVSTFLTDWPRCTRCSHWLVTPLCFRTVEASALNLLALVLSGMGAHQNTEELSTF